jgi:predicted TIM-barrel fold metal-dependent hydrolase
MIIDCHTHFMQPEYLDKRLHPQWRAVGYEPFPKMTFERYDEAMTPVDRAIVFGIRANALGVVTPNERIAELVARRPDKYIGFMALDPTDPGAISEMDRCVSDLGLKGIKLYPTMQHCDIRDARFFPFFHRAQQHRLPILLHLGASPFPGSILRYSQPLLLDEVAPAFPEVKFIIAHLGHPWQRDTAIVVRKHPNVFADISGVWHRPWEGYNAIITCIEWGVTEKLLFGSDYPLWTPAEAMAKLRTLNDQVSGTRLPQIPEDVIEGIIQRNALAVLGLQ